MVPSAEDEPGGLNSDQRRDLRAWANQLQQNEHSASASAPKTAPPSKYGTLSPSQTKSVESQTPSSAPPVSPSSSSKSSERQPQLVGGEGYQLLERIGQGQFGEVYRALAPGGVVVA